MSAFAAGDQAAEDWVGCLVLAVAPTRHMARIAEAVLRAERTIFADPVLVDMARVAIASTPDPLGGDLDDVALGLHRELVAWAQSPVRNPAPRVTFCVLLAHPDVAEADRLIHKLAAANALSELPIVFRIGRLRVAPEPPDTDIRTEADQDEDLTRIILDAVAATAHEVDRTPDFCLTANQLTAVVAGIPSGFSPLSAPSLAPILVPERGMPQIGPISTRTEPGSDDSAPSQHTAGSAVPLARRPSPPTPLSLPRRWSLPRPRSLPRRRSLPRNSIEVIDALSERARQVSMLYLVLVAEPVRPSRQSRKRRIEVARSLASALMRSDDSGHGRWYVRAFTAGRELRAGSPLPGPDLLQHKDFPQRWGEFFDLYDGVGDIIDSIGRDTSSFVRRGLEPPRTTVIFLAGPAPSGGADSARRVADLCGIAETIWVSFDYNAPTSNFISAGARFLPGHEDLVDELLAIIADRPPASDAPIASPADIPAGPEVNVAGANPVQAET